MIFMSRPGKDNLYRLLVGDGVCGAVAGGLAGESPELTAKLELTCSIALTHFTELFSPFEELRMRSEILSDTERVTYTHSLLHSSLLSFGVSTL